MRSIRLKFLSIVSCFILVCSPIATAEVVFAGLDAAQEANVRLLMPLVSTPCSAARWRIERLFADAESDLRQALEALGYYDVELEKSLEFEGDCWLATFSVSVGSPVVLENVDVEYQGDVITDAEFRELVQESRPVPGDVLNHGRYERYKALLLRQAVTRGYFDAALTQSAVVVDPDSYSASIAITLDSGPRYRFGDVTFTNGILRQDLMAGFTDIQTGDYYHSGAINDLYGVLNGSSYFRAVSVSTEPLDSVQKTVPVDVSLQPGPRKTYSAGAGFTTDTGPHGRLGYTDRRRNDRGHQFESNLSASPVKSELTAAYRWPMQDPRSEWFNAVIGYQHEDTETSENDIYKIGIQRSRSLKSSWLETRFADYAFENFKVGDQDTSSRLLILGTNWESATGRELSRVSDGLRLNFGIRGAHDVLASDTTFLQFSFATKWIRSLTDNVRVLARASVGITEKEDLTELPVSVRFFAGGDRSVRGYDFKTLGPADDDGLIIGGSNLVEGSIEFDYLFKSNWAVAAFADTGSAFNNTDVELNTGVGVGLRWYSPVGPIRLDLAHPLEDPDQKVRVHISLGLEL